MFFILKVKNFKRIILTRLELNRLVIFPIASIILFELLFWLLNLKSADIFSSVTKSDLHSKILSVNATLAGFLFTGLNILLSSSNKQIMKLLNLGPYLKITQNGIISGIYSHLFSMLIGFVCMINAEKNIQPILVNIEFLFFIIGVVYFSMAMWEIKKIIDEIRKENLKEFEKTDKELEVDVVKDETAL